MTRRGRCCCSCYLVAVVFAVDGDGDGDGDGVGFAPMQLQQPLAGSGSSRQESPLANTSSFETICSHIRNHNRIGVGVGRCFAVLAGGNAINEDASV